jgi:peptidoglycan hydrolase CwlO-like protein
MEISLSIAISVISVTIAVLGFVFSRKDKATNEVKEETAQYAKHDLIEYRLNKIEQQLEKILSKLDSYDKEIELKIKEAMKHHINEFHTEH